MITNEQLDDEIEAMKDAFSS